MAIRPSSSSLRLPTASRCSSGRRRPSRWSRPCCCRLRLRWGSRRWQARWRLPLRARAWGFPRLSCAAAVADRALALSLIAGAVALLLAYISIRNRKLIQPGSEALLEQWQRQSGNGDAKRLKPQGTFDKAEIARGTSYDEPFAIDDKLRHHLPLIEKRRAGWSKLFAILTPLGFAAVIAVMVLP